MAQVVAVLCDDSGHLQDQFTRGRQHRRQRPGRRRTGAMALHALRRAAHARTLWFRLFADALNGRQNERGGFARTSLVCDQQAVAEQVGRNGLRLHRRGRGVVHFTKCTDNVVV